MCGVSFAEQVLVPFVVVPRTPIASNPRMVAPASRVRRALPRLYHKVCVNPPFSRSCYEGGVADFMREHMKSTSIGKTDSQPVTLTEKARVTVSSGSHETSRIPHVEKDCFYRYHLPFPVELVIAIQRPPGPGSGVLRVSRRTPWQSPLVTASPPG
jgi:hypothetical protein